MQELQYWRLGVPMEVCVKQDWLGVLVEVCVKQDW